MKKLGLLLSASLAALAVSSTSAFAIPIPLFILGPLATFGATIGLSTAAVAGIIAGVTNVALSLALNFATNKLFAPKAPKPEERQSMSRESTKSRFRSYGRVKTGGVLAYVTKRDGKLYRVIVLGQGEIDAVEEWWIDENLVTLDANGDALEPKYASYLNIKNRNGSDLETAYSELITAASLDWSVDHRGNGMPHCLNVISSPPISKQQEMFPRGEPNVRAVQRAAKVFDPRDITQFREDETTWKWRDNAALVILDFLTHKDGAKMPWSFFEGELPKWIQAANICDEIVPLKSGGTVARWKICGSYDLIERPAVTLKRMLDACDGEMSTGPSGAFVLSVGKFVPPTITIDDSAIIDSEVTRGKNRLDGSNIIKVQYTSPLHDYQATEAQEWRDDDDVAKRGEIIQPFEAFYIPNHSQARRIAKREAARSNPSWAGSATCNVRGLKILGHRYIRMVDSENGIDEPVEIIGNAEIIIDPATSVLMGVRFSWQSISPDIDEWDAATEEGEAPPAPPPISVDNTIQAMTGLLVAVEQVIVASGQSAAVAAISWTGPINNALLPQIEIKLSSGSDATWTLLSVAENQDQTRSGILIDGEIYHVRGRFQSAGGTNGAWTVPYVFTAVADTIAPPVVTVVSGVGGTGQATLNWTSPENVHYVKAKIYRSTANVFSGSTFIKDVFGPRNSAQSTVDSSLAAGTYYYWVGASNGSNVLAAEVATGSVVVI